MSSFPYPTQADDALHRARSAERTALYRFYDSDDELLYVGISRDPAERWKQHRDKPWWREVAMRVIEWHDDRVTAERAERKAIRSEGPRYNIQHNPRPAAKPVVEEPVRSHRTLVDVYADRDLTDEQARKIVALLRLGDVR
jgi:predicted GIY-YIG superfamily endonuclease